MGVMIEGVWHADEPASGSADDGKYRRSVSTFRNWITPDGAPGPDAREGGFAAESGRYHLYAAVGCPWAHRTMIVRVLKGLENIISLDTVLPKRSAEGWVFAAAPGEHCDSLFGSHALHEIYNSADLDFSGRVTVPVLWDKKRQIIVNNESSEIIRMLNSAFDDVGARGPDLYPVELRSEIDALNERVYRSVNNGVYRTGFARSQEAYEEAFDDLFEALDMLEARLSSRRYLCGAYPCEADWRLFPTLVRFDVAYFGAFKCNLRPFKIILIYGDMRASSIRYRASPKPAILRLTSRAIIRPANYAILWASSPRAQSSILPRRTAARDRMERLDKGPSRREYPKVREFVLLLLSRRSQLARYEAG